MFVSRVCARLVIRVSVSAIKQPTEKKANWARQLAAGDGLAEWVKNKEERNRVFLPGMASSTMEMYFAQAGRSL
jgi:hypothetical protein